VITPDFCVEISADIYPRLRIALPDFKKGAILNRVRYKCCVKAVEKDAFHTAGEIG
jgi:hypothetical protein